MNFGLIFYTVVDPIIVYIKIFCLNFFETLKCHFRIFLENGLHGARAPLGVFDAYGCYLIPDQSIFREAGPLKFVISLIWDNISCITMRMGAT
jgi:hypothetical protein